MRVVPTAYDLERFLIASGLIGLTPTVREKYLDLDLAVDAAYEDFQRDTKIRPFLAETSDTTRYYPVNGPYVQIHPYFTITSIHTKSTPFETTSESKTHITDYIRLPDQETPITALEFNYYFYPASSSIGVTGRRGWSDDLPADVFQAIQEKAGIKLQPSISAAIHDGAIEWTEGDVREKHGSMGAFSSVVQSWDKDYWDVVNRYKQTKVAGA